MAVAGASSPRIADIQVLRGLAVSLVFCQHFASWMVGPDGIGFYPFGALWIGVDIFFAISGYLIVSKLIEVGQGDFWPNMAVFWRRRVFRLMPAAIFWGFVAVAVVFAFGVSGATSQQVVAGFASSLSGTSNFYWSACADGTLSSVVCADRSPFGVYWSLSLEEQFYLLASIFLLTGRIKLFVAAVIAVIAWNLTTVWDAAWPWGWTTRPYGLATGAFLALGLNRFPALAKYRLDKSDRIALAVVILIAIGTLSLFQMPITTLVIGVLCAALVWMARMDGCYSLGPFGRFMAFVGERSYSFYLSHVVVLIVCAEALSTLGLTEKVGAGVPGWGVMLISYGLCVLVASLSYRQIEERFRHQKQKGPR